MDRKKEEEEFHKQEALSEMFLVDLTETVTVTLMDLTSVTDS
jgi:hypothetical protein